MHWFQQSESVSKTRGFFGNRPPEAAGDEATPTDEPVADAPAADRNPEAIPELAWLRRIPGFWPFGGVALTIALAMAPAWFSTDRLAIGADTLLVYYPQQVLLRDQLFSGHLPFWNPYTLGGMPAFADPHTTYLYPPHWLVLWLPAIVAINWMIGLHVILAGVGAAWFARVLGANREGQFLGGIAFALGSTMVSRLEGGHIWWLEAYAWVPFATGFAADILRPRAVVFLSLSIAAMTLVEPEIFAFMGWWLPLWALFGLLVRGDFRTAWLSTLARLAVGMSLGVALTALQLLPTQLGLVVVSNRRQGVDFAAASLSSLPPWHLLTALAPAVFGNPSNGSYWVGQGFSWHERLVYLGIVPLVALFRATGRWRYPCWIAAALALIVSFGSYTPVFALVHRLPIYDSLRVPPRELGLACLALSGAAGLGLNRVRGARTLAIALIAAGALVIAAFTFGFWFPVFSWLLGGASDLPHVGIEAAAAAALVPLLIPVAFLLAIGLAMLLPSRIIVYALLGIAVIDLVLVLSPWRVAPTDPNDQLVPAASIRGQPRAAIYGYSGMLLGNFGPVIKTTLPTGYEPLFNADYSVLTTGYYQAGVGFGIDQTDVEMLRLLGYRVVADNDKHVVTLLTPPRSPVWVAHCTRPGGALDVRQPAFPRLQCITRENTTEADPVAPAGAATVIAQQPSSLRVRADGPGWLVTSIPSYPGWSAKVDGHAAPVQIVDGALVAANIPNGTHIVEFNYAPPGLLPGALLTLVSALFLIVLWRWESLIPWSRLQFSTLAPPSSEQSQQASE